jgi:hypothetical protein
MLIGREIVRIFAAEHDVFLKERRHRGKVVRRPRLGPGHVGGRAPRIRPLHIIGRHLDGLREIAARDPDDARLVAVWCQALAIGRKIVEQLAELRIDGFFVGELAQERGLATARVGPFWRHVGRHVPVEHGVGIADVGDLKEPPLDLGELRLGRDGVPAVAGFGLGFCGLGFFCSGHVMVPRGAPELH